MSKPLSEARSAYWYWYACPLREYDLELADCRLMRPLCGNLTLNLEQGPVTGMLADMGLNKSQVWKLQ